MLIFASPSTFSARRVFLSHREYFLYVASTFRVLSSCSSVLQSDRPAARVVSLKNHPRESFRPPVPGLKARPAKSRPAASLPSAATQSRRFYPPHALYFPCTSPQCQCHKVKLTLSTNSLTPAQLATANPVVNPVDTV
jgi:hypothetical protein